MAWLCAAAPSLLPAQVPVRFPEGTVRGYLALSNEAGERIADGNVFQTREGDSIESRMVFRFYDGSLFEEVTRFTQDQVFRLRGYELTLRGPAFEEDWEISLDASTGNFRARTRDRSSGEEKLQEDAIELEPDVYNGLVMIIAKNLGPGRSQDFHFVAFMPEPQMIVMELLPAGQETVPHGRLEETAVRYEVKPKLGPARDILARLLGSRPPDSYAWIIRDPVPTFLRFRGPLFPTGPVWQIDLIGPGRPQSDVKRTTRQR